MRTTRRRKYWFPLCAAAFCIATVMVCLRHHRTPPAVERIAIGPIESVLVVGQTQELVVWALPYNAKADISWTVDDSEVVCLENGIITALSPGETTIIATAEDISASCIVKVVADIKKLEVDLAESKANYLVGDNVKDGDVVLTVTYADRKKEVLTSDFSLSYDFTTPGEKEIAISYLGETTYFGVTVRSQNIEDMTLVTLPEKTQYEVGDRIDMTGLSVKVCHKDGFEEVITDGFTCELEQYIFDSQVCSVAGETYVIISYGDRWISVPIEIKDKDITM